MIFENTLKLLNVFREEEEERCKRPLWMPEAVYLEGVDVNVVLDVIILDLLK